MRVSNIAILITLGAWWGTLFADIGLGVWNKEHQHNAHRYGDYYPGPVASTPAVCTPATGVLNSATSSVSIACPGAASYIITITPTSGQPAFVGTITSTDSLTSGGRLLFKTGVNELDTTTETLTGAQGSLEYRAIGSPTTGGEKISVASYTSGSATVTIYGGYSPNIEFLNGPVHTAEEAALRAGHAYSASSGLQMVTAGQYESIYFANPANSGWRAIITDRILSCDTPSGNTAPHWYSLGNPSVNLPPTAGTISNRRTGGVPSILTFTYTASGTAYPDTSPVTPLASRIDGVVPTGGLTRDITAERTIEPGNSYALTILGAANGLGTNPYCTIDLTWYEESTN